LVDVQLLSSTDLLYVAVVKRPPAADVKPALITVIGFRVIKENGLFF